MPKQSRRFVGSAPGLRRRATVPCYAGTMRIRHRLVAPCHLGLVLAASGCSETDGPEAWRPSTTADVDPSVAESDTAAAEESSTGLDDAGPASTGVGASEGSSGDDVLDTGATPDIGTVPMPVALPQGFELPFSCGDTWRLDSWGHAPALDMVREPDQHGTEGAPLFAPAAGVVNQSYFHANAGNMVQIDHGEGWFTTFIHMDSRAVEVGDVLVQGDTIGAVGRTGPTSNNHPHLHFELGIDANGDGEASWGFSGAERVNPWFGGVEYGQSNALTWRDVVSLNCP